MAEPRLFAALVLSVVIHAMVVGAPGWHLPFAQDEPELSATLEARLAPAASKAVAAATPAVRPKPRKARPAPPLPTPGAAPEAAAPTPPPGPTEAAPALAPETAPLPSTPAPAAMDIPLPRQGRIRFQVLRGEGELGMPLGRSVHAWRHDGATYSFQVVTETTGLVALFRSVRIEQASEGTIGAGGLEPREFRVARNGQPAEGARFDWSGMKLSLRNESGATREMALSPGAQDLLSQTYQIGILGPAARRDMMVATGKNYGRYVFEAIGEETLATPFGELRAWHVKTPGLPGEQVTELWLAADHHNLPLRIRYRDRKGDLYEQNAVDVEVDGARWAERAQ